MECVVLLDQQCELDLKRLNFDYRFADNGLCATAAKHGQYEMLEFLLNRELKAHYGWLQSAAASGDLPCLMLLVNNRAGNIYEANGTEACVHAALNDHVACLKYLHELGCRMSADVCIEAATAGSLRCLQFFHENGGEWNFLATHAAARNGHLDCLQYAYENGCQFVPGTLREDLDLQNGSTKLGRSYRNRLGVKEGPTHLVEMVARREHWGCVLYLIAQHYPLTVGFSELLARKHKDNLLMLAIERGCPVATVAGIRLAKVGNLEGLKLALDQGYARSTEILCAAAYRGHLQCLMLAHERGCPWSQNVCVAAARGGHLNCLQYVREHGCPWDGRVRQEAGKVGREDILEYVQENNCPRLIKSDLVKKVSGKRKRASFMW